MGPFVVVEGSELDLRVAVQEIVNAGWRLEPGFGPPHSQGTVVRSGTIGTSAEAAAALVAALAGQGLVARMIAPRDVADRLIDDLRRLGPVEYRLGRAHPAPDIEPDARAILGLLAEGQSLGEAAVILGISRRTADRRLALARHALGAKRTTEAIARARRLGWLLDWGGRHPD
jgi:DNA-binding CsgD family transcriptional regulator